MKYQVDLSKFHDVTLGKVFGKKPLTSAQMLDKLWKFLVKNDLIKPTNNLRL